MSFSKNTINEYKADIDKKFSYSCLIMIIFIALCAILNAFGMFGIKSSIIYICSAVATVICLIPSAVYLLFDYHERWVRFTILGLLCFQAGFYYCVMSYHAVMIFIFPLLISMIFNDKRYVIFTMGVQIPILIASHYIAWAIKLVPNDPLINSNDVLLYGIFPRLVIYLAVGLFSLFATSRTRKLIEDLGKKNDELYEEEKEIILALSQIIEGQVEKRGNHIVRVSLYTAILCKGMGYNDEDTFKASLASMLHDVGNIEIPQEILLKEDKLTPIEYEKVKEHVQRGYELLNGSQSELMELAKVIAHEHHERWDGQGYLKMKGEAINRFARCVTLADVFDTLMNRRPYREKFTEQSAYLEIVTDKGTHFDPRLVDVFAVHYKEFLEIARKYPSES